MCFPTPKKKKIKDTFLGAEGFNLETGLACASLSITLLPRRYYNYSSVNSLRQEETQLSPASLHTSTACKELP